MMLLRASAVSVVLSAIALTFASAQQCALCSDGAEADVNLTIGGPEGVTCKELSENVELGSDSCLRLQLLGYTDCGCPTFPAAFCPMCQYGFIDIPNKNQLVPGTNDKCVDRLFVRSNEVESCDDAMKPGYVCGCPGAAEPACNICGDSESAPAALEERLVIDGVGSFTCQEFVDQALLGSLDAEHCTLVQAAAKDTCDCINPNNPGDSTTEAKGGPSPAPTSTTQTATDSSTTSEESSAARLGPAIGFVLFLAHQVFLL